MSEVRNLLRGSLLITALLVFATCARQGGDGGGGNTLRANPCAKGTGNADRNAPIVCVDDSGSTLSVHPDPVTVHRRSGGAPVMIHWWTRSGGGVLGIEIQAGCVTEVNCNGPHCSARTLPGDTGGARCKYDVWTDTKPRLDPEVIIVDCCSP